MKSHHQTVRGPDIRKAFYVAEVLLGLLRGHVIVADGTTTAIRRGVVYVLIEEYSLVRARRRARVLKEDADAMLRLHILSEALRVGRWDIVDTILRIPRGGETP